MASARMALANGENSFFEAGVVMVATWLVGTGADYLKKRVRFGGFE
jgi:hypothetical protein